jgi:hypothetical protein
MRICWFARLREPDCVPSGPPAYDGLIVGWTGYTNIPTRVRRVAFLKARAREPCRNRPLKFVSCAAQWLPRRGSCLPDGQLFRFFSPGRRERLGGWGIVSAMPGTRIHLRATSVKTELHVFKSFTAASNADSGHRWRCRVTSSWILFAKLLVHPQFERLQVLRAAEEVAHQFRAGL